MNLIKRWFKFQWNKDVNNCTLGFNMIYDENYYYMYLKLEYHYKSQKYKNSLKTKRHQIVPLWSC